MSNLIPALAYANRHGKLVFPCHANKHPLTANGYKDASRDPAIIGGWWDRNPDALIGLPTGRINGTIVLDIGHADLLRAPQVHELVTDLLTGEHPW